MSFDLCTYFTCNLVGSFLILVRKWLQVARPQASRECHCQDKALARSLLPEIQPFFCLIFTIFPTMNSHPLRAADFEVTVLPAGGAPQCPEQGKGKHSATNDRRRV